MCARVNKTAKISREIGISPVIQRLDECSRWTATIFDGDEEGVGNK